MNETGNFAALLHYEELPGHFIAKTVSLLKETRDSKRDLKEDRLRQKRF